MTESYVKNGYLAVAPPQTPRSRTTNSGRSGVTPSFSFGLGFSPSFQLSSAKITASISPRSYLQTGNELNRVISGKRMDEIDGFKHGDRTKEGDIFDALTPPESSNKFLDTLKLHTNNGGGSISNDTLTPQDSIDLWSLGNDTNHTQLGSLSGYDDAKNPMFLTPRKLVIDNPRNKDLGDDDHEESVVDANDNRLIRIKPKVSEEEDAGEQTPANLFSKPKKRRKLTSSANGLTDSPNNSIASQIDMAIESPSNRKKPVVSESLENNSDKVWYDELDNVLIKSYTKYIHFRRNQSFDSSILKHTSQNKVLSRMLLNKTGILRTANQISSRLFRLAKMKKLTKAKSKTDGYDYEEEFSAHKNDIDDVITTPLESLISSTSAIDTAKSNELIDKELDLIFTSPEFHDNLHSSPIFDDQWKALTPLEFKPTEMVISFKHSKDRKKSHTFSSLNPYSAPSLNEIASRKELTESLKDKLNPNLMDRLTKERKPFLLINNMISFTPKSDASIQKSPYRDSKLIDTSNGSFVSFIKINVLNYASLEESILNWNCLIKVYNKDDLLFESTDLINAYKRGTNYELNIPFIKKFWPGYLSFLHEGADDESIGDLLITQTFYENENNTIAFNETQSNIFGCIVHKFAKANSSKGVSIVVTNNLLDDKVDDDNATVVANSSPYKPSSSPIISVNRMVSEINRNTTMKPLMIDVTKANTIISGGRASAPVYNANLVHEFNQKVLSQKDRGNGEYPNKSGMSQPVLSHSQSTNMVQQYHMDQPVRSNSYAGGLQATSTPVIHHKEMVTSTPNQQVHYFNNNMKQDQLEQQHQQFVYSQRPSLQEAPAVLQEQNMTPTMNQHNMMGLAEKGSYGKSPQFNQMNAVFSAPASQTHFFNQSTPIPPNNGQQPIQQGMSAQIPPQIQMTSQMQMQMQHVQPPPPSQQQHQQQMAQQMQMQFQQHMQQPLLQPLHQSVQQPVQQPVPQVMSTAKNNTHYSQAPKTSSKSHKESNKENVNPNGIKFGPILEYDPSKDAHQFPTTKTKPSMTGVYRFPLNTQVMYKPKKN